MREHVIGSHCLFFLEGGAGRRGEALPLAGGRSPPPALTT